MHRWSIFKKQLCNNAAFTLIEVLTTLTLIGVIAAVSVPSMLGLIEHGKQINRMNVARTLYLAVQNQITRLHSENNLKSVLTGYYYKKTDDGLFYTDVLDEDSVSLNNVAAGLGEYFPNEEPHDYIRYINKPIKYEPTPGEDELNAFYALLDEIILDKSILDGAILMEYNIDTGVVLSIFYSDAFDGQAEFDYYDSAEYNVLNNVTGGRGGDGYHFATTRRQGFYGGDSTGQPSPVNFQDIVNIYDGSDTPLCTVLGETKENVLYAEILLAKPAAATPEYTFQIVKEEGGGHSGSLIPPLTVDDFASLTSFDSFDYDSMPAAPAEAFYRDDRPIKIYRYGIDIGGSYERYIWILDCIEGDIQAAQPRSIANYDGLREPQNVYVKALTAGGEQIISESAANTHFGGVLSDGRLEIKSARHLNNIRYWLGGHFRQTDDIDMKPLGSEITRFAPIGGETSFVSAAAFSGSYLAMKNADSQYRISNLDIFADGGSLGLFSETSGEIRGVSLYEATVQSAAGGNVGGIAGKMSGGKITQCNSYANISAHGFANVGGLVGHIAAGALDQSFNAGFYDAQSSPLTSGGFGSVTTQGGSAGGLVGLNNGSIQDSFNNARVNINRVSTVNESDSLDKQSHTPIPEDITAQALLGGIAGSNTGTIGNTYATNFVAIYSAHGSSSGGIAGQSSGILIDNYYIANDCIDTGAVEKDALWSDDLCGLSSAYKKGGAYAAGNTLYANYPYPVLKNNNPIVSENTWGWEDVLTRDVTAPSLVYYEVDKNDLWAYLPSRDPLKAIDPSDPARLVKTDGYCIELSSYTGGYKLQIDSREFEINTALPQWTITEDGSSLGWPVEEFSTDEGEMRRVFIPNAVAENISSGGAISLSVYQGADADPLLASPLFTQSYNPLFAPAFASSGSVIRSPRHLDNIDKALGGDYTQQLNLDFSIYRKELTLDCAVDDAATLPTDDAVVSGTFTGTYLGRQISNVLISASNKTDVGLFAATSGTIQGVSLFNASINAANVSNIGGIAGRMTGGGITQSSGYANIEAAGSANAGGLVGRISSGVLEQSFNAGFYNAHTDTQRGVGSVTAKGGNIGGLVGLNNGVIQNSFNNARVNIENVSLHADAAKLSRTPVYSPVTAQANLGGIAGGNTGEISNTYATNFVAIYAGSASGGIAGLSSGVLSNNFYISNDNIDHIAVYKDTLQELASGEFIKGGDYIAGNNSYANYPYPIIRNNQPDSNAWGWEDILAADLGTADLLYYELYDGNSWGYSRNRYHSSSLSDKLVIHDGYGVEFTFNRGGYNLKIGSNAYILTVSGSEDSAVWTVTEEGGSAPLNWPVGQFISTIGGQTKNMYRLYFPNGMSEDILGSRTHLTVSMYLGANPDSASEPLFTQDYNPLFSPTSMEPGSVRQIRSPRHLDNIDRAPGYSYTQQLNVDFSLYYKELTTDYQQVDTGTRLPTNAAVVTGTFTGVYNGNVKTIANLAVNNSSLTDAGLFAVNSGSIKNVTLVNPSVRGGQNAGAVAGTNTGAISLCSVQNDISNAEQPPMVIGANAGGIAGNNKGTITDVTVASTSGLPAVSGDSAGGIAGITTGTVDRIMYLAVAPKIGSAVYPFAGAGSVGNNKYYLSGTKAMRPYQTLVNSVSSTDYNYLDPGNIEAKNTVGIVNQPLFANWIKNTLTAAAVTDQDNRIFPYPYPNGTAPPVNWPIVDDIVLITSDGVDGIVYYEKYEDGTVGVFARREEPKDSGNFVDVDYLNNEGVVSECGFGIYLPNGVNENAERQAWISQDNGKSWTVMNSFKFRNETLDVPYLNHKYSIFNFAELLRLAEKASNPADPFIIWVSSENGNGGKWKNPLAVAYINPFFAKEVYSVSYNPSPANHNQTITSNQVYPKTHSIRTPWQMQQISKTTAGANFSQGHTFVQELDLSFASAKTTEQNDGVTPVITNSTANIIKGAFKGVYDGNGKMISSLSLTGSASGKGLFDNIGGELKKLTMYDCRIQNGSGNGGFAAKNDGKIENAAFVSSDTSAPVNGASSGGIVSENTGVINNALYLGLAPNSNPIAWKSSSVQAPVAYYLSGTIANYGLSSINDYFAVIGTRKTTQELNALDLGEAWSVAAEGSRNTMASGYPYPFIGKNPPAGWLLATVPASALNYYELYEDESVGFYSPGATPTLDDIKPIKEAGYCAIVPYAGGYSVKQTSNGTNTHIKASSYDNKYYVKLPSSFTFGAEVYVNDNRVSNENTRFVNTLFAKLITGSAASNQKTFIIRTADQFVNINTRAETNNLIFSQERSLDFSGKKFDDAVIRNEFMGAYTAGNGHSISNVQIDSVNNNIGLFGQNSGKISGIILKPDTSIKAADRVGGIVGHNLPGGLISDCIVEGEEDVDNPGKYIGMRIEGSGVNVGGIAGLDDGNVKDCTVSNTASIVSGN